MVNEVVSFTTMLTVSAMLVLRSGTSVTTNANVMRVSASTCSDVKVGLAADGSSKSTPVAVTSIQVKAKKSPSGSELPVPTRVTRTPSFTTWSGPADATGGLFAVKSMTVTVPVAIPNPPFVT